MTGRRRSATDPARTRAFMLRTLTRLATTRDETARELHETALEANAAGIPWRQIGAAIGMSGSGAHYLAHSDDTTGTDTIPVQPFGMEQDAP